MSWSLSAIGKPQAIKTRLASQFEQAKKNTAHIPHEQKAVELAEQIVNGELDFAHEQGTIAVTVNAGGSASIRSGDWPGNSQINVKVEPIYGFIE